MGNRRWFKIECLHRAGDGESRRLKVAALPSPKRLRAGRSKSFLPDRLSPFPGKPHSHATAPLSGGRGEREEMIHLSPVRVILYDLGNVILPFNHYQIAEKLSGFCQKKEHGDPQGIFSYLFDLEKGIINDFEVGKVSSREFFRSLKEHLGLSISFEEFLPIWTDIFSEN